MGILRAVVRLEYKWDIDPHRLQWRENVAGDIEICVDTNAIVPDQIAQPWCTWLLNVCWPHRPRLMRPAPKPLLGPDLRTDAQARRAAFEDVDPVVAFPSADLAWAYAVDGGEPARSFFEALGVHD